MENLSNWDFATDFTGTEAAALILGIEPSAPATVDKTKAVFNRMKNSYWEACHYYGLSREIPAQERIITDSRILKSTSMVDRTSFQIESEIYLTFDEWLDSISSEFDRQSFSREELKRWLGAIGMKSVYPFNTTYSDAISAPENRWPWGDHHTELLGHLEAAASEFWLSYNPQDAKATAPKNTTVIAWLMERNVVGDKRKVSVQMATAIATMLRPDGLPTGPRRKLSDP